MKINEIIKEIMFVNRLSQDELAKILDVSQKAISNWINDVDTPNVNSIMSIYKNFDITPNELLGIETPINFKLLSSRKEK